MTAPSPLPSPPQQEGVPPQYPFGGALAENHGRSGSIRGFWSLIVTQFQGAFSDNVLKNLVVFMIIGGSLSLADEHKIGEQVGALFSLPFILFSMAGGYLADRLSKRTVMIGVKVFEVFVMIFVLIGFMTRQLWILECGIFLMGTHSAFFGPSKYSSLPELLPEKRLSWGNGILELGTFMAIILGTVLAGWLSQKLGQHQAGAGVILIGLAFAGLLASLGITKVPAANPAKKFRVNFVADLIVGSSRYERTGPWCSRWRGMFISRSLERCCCSIFSFMATRCCAFRKSRLDI